MKKLMFAVALACATSAFADARWTRSADGKTITDGIWTINVEDSTYDGRSGLMIGGIKTQPSELPQDLDLTGGVSDGSAIIKVKGWAFNQKSGVISTLKLPNTVVWFGERALYSTSFTLDYDFSSLEYADVNAFGSLKPLNTDLKLTNKKLTSISKGAFSSAKITSLEAPYVTYFGQDAFSGISDLTNVVFSREAVTLDVKAFNGVMNTGSGCVWFPGKAPTIINGTEGAQTLLGPSGGGWPRRKIYCGYRHDPEGWDAFAAITPMTDADDPPAQRPEDCFGIYKSSWGTRVVRNWLIRYDGADMSGLEVANDISTTVGTLSPEAGFHSPADGAVFAAIDGETEALRSFCLGWKHEILDAGGKVLSTDEGSTTTFTYSAADGELQRLIWRWSNEVAVAVGAYSGGSVSVNGATVAETGGKTWVAEGIGTVDLVATPDDVHKFNGWGSDVPDELRNKPAISLPSDRSWSLKPSFASTLPWTLSADGKTITDGIWTLNVERSTYDGRSGLMIDGIKEQPADLPQELDLTRGVSDGSAIIQVKEMAFNQIQNRISILRLPNTVVWFGKRALHGSTFTLDYDFSSLEYAEAQAFTSLKPLNTDLKLTNRKLTSLSAEAFINATLTSLEAPYVTNFGQSAFSSILGLTNVVFSKERVYLQAGAFRGSMNGANCHAWFPGKAPVCEDDGEADAQALFGPSGGGWPRRTIHCGYRHDPEGWDAFAAITPMTDKDDPPAQRPADCFGIHKANWETRIVRDWLIKYKGYVGSGMMLILR